MDRTMVGCKLAADRATVESVLRGLAGSVPTASAEPSIAELVTGLTCRDSSGDEIACPYDLLVTASAPYEWVTEFLRDAERDGQIAHWAAFEIVEFRTFERTIDPGDLIPQRWKKVAFIKSRPGIDDFRNQYARHFANERHNSIHSWKYRQNDVARQEGRVIAVDGISEFWRHSEDLLAVYSRESFIDTDPFVDHDSVDGSLLVIHGIERIVLM